MAITLEQVEQLRAKADVSYTDARAALEQSNGDLLGALIWLEQRGKLRTEKGGFYSTDGSGKGEETEEVLLPIRTERRRERRSVQNELEIWRKGKAISSVPIIILIVLMVLGFWVVIPALIVGLFLACKYSFAGPNLGREDLNEIMDTVSDAADQIKAEFQKHSK